MRELIRKTETAHSFRWSRLGSQGLVTEARRGVQTGDTSMSTGTLATHATAPTQFLQIGPETYAYRRFGAGRALPLLFLQHFTGTLDNWDPAVTDALPPVER